MPHMETDMDCTTHGHLHDDKHARSTGRNTGTNNEPNAAASLQKHISSRHAMLTFFKDGISMATTRHYNEA